jgi:hypothetical protein
MLNRERVQKVRRALKTKADYVFFFDNLKSDMWVQPLADEGFFSDPPTGEESEGGGIRFPPWPESQYLARVAEQAPELVINVASKLPHTDNPSVQRDLVSMALKVEPIFAQRLVDKVLEWIESPYSGWLHSEYFGRLLVHLANGAELGAALKIAQKLLEFLPDPEQDKKRSAPETVDFTLWTRLEPRPRSPVYVYQEILEKRIPALLKGAPLETLRLLGTLLDQAITLGTRDRERSDGQDWSAIWLPALESPSRRIDFDSKAALAASLVRCAEAVLAQDVQLYSEVEEIFNSHSWRFFERVVLHLATQHPTVTQERLRRFILNIRKYEGTDFNHEYFGLIHDHFGLLSEAEKRKVIGIILEGPAVQTYIEERKSWGDEPSRDDIQRYVRRWQVLRLYPIKDHLNSQESQTYAELLRDGGEPTARSYIHYHGAVETSWGPHSPKSEKELIEAEPHAVLDFLKTWESGDEFNASSPEGLARAFQQAVTERSFKYSREAGEFTGIEPAYIRALISGLAEAVKGKKPIDWPSTLKLCAWVVKQPVEIAGRLPDKWDWEAGDLNWRGARKAVATLIQNGTYAGDGQTPFSLRKEVFDVLVPLTQDTDPTPEYDDESEWRSKPATLAINTVRGKAMHALVAHAMWVHRHLSEPERKGLAAMSEVQKLLEHGLDFAIERTRAIRSVFGQYFSYLCHIDRVWTERHLSSIFPLLGEQKALRDAAWNTYVTFNQPRIEVFQLLVREYERALENLTEPKGTEQDVGNPDEALAEHLLILYWWKVLDFESTDGLLDRFYSAASEELRGYVTDFVGRTVEKETATLSKEFLARLMRLWERRLNEAKQHPRGRKYNKELLGFAWWLHSRKFDPSWLLAQTAEVLRLCQEVDNEFLFIESLAHFSAEYPAEAASCLLLLIEKLHPDRCFALDRDEVRKILKSAFASKDPKVIEVATVMRDSLLARGNFSFRNIGQPVE